MPADLRRLLPVMACLALAACVPVDTAADPYQLVAAGNAAIQATQAAMIDRAQQATIDAGRSQDALQATAQAMGAQATATVAAWQWSITATAQAQNEQAAQASATAAAQAAISQATSTAQAVAATATAVQIETVNRVEAAQATAARRQFWSVIYPLLTLVILSGSGVLTWRLVMWQIAWLDRRKSLVYTPQGVVAFLPDGNGYSVPSMLVPQHTAATPPRMYINGASRDGDLQTVESLTPSGSVLASPIVHRSQPDGITVLARDLVQAAIDQLGPEARTLPGHRHLRGWNAEKWSRVVASLKASGAAHTAPTGTVIADQYMSLQALMYDLETGALRLRPAPFAAPAESE